MTKFVPKKETIEQIFDKHYDNDNKLCTRKSLFYQFKTVAKEWLQQKKHNVVELYPKNGILRIENRFIDELLEELK